MKIRVNSISKRLDRSTTAKRRQRGRVRERRRGMKGADGGGTPELPTKTRLEGSVST